MLNNKEITQEIQRLSSFHTLVETYEEIAASRMRRIRASVLKSRSFIAELGGIFEELKASYKQQVAKLMKHNKHAKSGTSFRKHNGKTLALLLSANTGLYGGILQTTIASFNDFVNKNDCDVAIVGRYAKTVFENNNPGRAFTFFDFPDRAFTPEETKQVLSAMLVYSNVYVFHGQFVSMVKQEPNMAVLSAENTGSDDTKKADVKYFFEPSLEEILVFFEEEIVAALFEQTVHESELAKYASRMVTLDKSTVNIKTQVKKVENMRRLLAHRAMNKKQQDSLVGMKLWHK
jgi:ATP synthase F1 gamma subunit